MIAIAAAVVLCSTDDVDSALSSSDSSGSSNLETDAYLTVNIVTAATTRADDVTDGFVDGGTQDGDTVYKIDEDAVKSLLLLAFDDSQTYINYYTMDESEQTDGKWVFKLPSASVNFFVMTNPTDDLVTNLQNIIDANGNHTWSVMYDALMIAVDFATTASLNQDGSQLINYPNFIMVNAGAYSSSSTQNTILATVSTETGKLSTEESSPSSLSIVVDRLTAKFTSTASSIDVISVDANAAASYVGMCLNATNRKGFIYSTIVKLSSTYGTDYRKDPNYSIVYTGTTDAELAAFRTELMENFNWMSNTPTTSRGEYNFLKTSSDDATAVEAYFTAFNNTGNSSNPEYVVENTADGAYQDYNNLTQSIVKMAYTPASLITAVDQSAGTSASTSTGSANTYIDSSFTGLVGENAYVVAYYLAGVNYYDVFIQHDSTETPFIVGRWGMVRNNWYTLSINSVSGPGLPYIPDPTDPAITDPNNPDPTDPEPGDTEYGYLDVTITNNPWTTWTQSTVLGDTESAVVE